MHQVELLEMLSTKRFCTNHYSLGNILFIVTVTAQLNNAHDATMHMMQQCIQRDITGEPAEGRLTC